MKISIITVVYNGARHILTAINSVLSQNYPDIEYIVVDGGSTDGTVDIVNEYLDRISIFISEPDVGIFDAMNKGVEMASGEIIGILNSDDFYVNNEVIDLVIQEFNNKDVDSVFADLVYVKANNFNKTVRYYDSGQFKPYLFAYGLTPAHPTFFVKRIIYEKYGKYRIDMKNAADYELLVRFLYVNQVTYHYINKVIVKMRMGGASTTFKLSSVWTNNIEIVKACRTNGIKTNILIILTRYFFKLISFLKKP